MNEFFDKVMVALLPTTTDWCRIELPHLTLSYLGKVEDLRLSLHNELLKEALTLSMDTPPILVKVMSVEEFGEEDKVDVLLLDNSPLLKQLNKAFAEWDTTDFSFTPHCTIGPKGSVVGLTVPEFLTFDRITVSWGEEVTTFKLFG